MNRVWEQFWKLTLAGKDEEKQGHEGVREGQRCHHPRRAGTPMCSWLGESHWGAGAEMLPHLPPLMSHLLVPPVGWTHPEAEE